VNEQDLIKLGFVQQPDGSYARQAVAPVAPAPEPEPDSVPPLASHPQTEVRSATRRRVRITVCTQRLRDPDNNCVKWLIDSLRYFGILADDSPEHITLEVVQRKVKTKQEQGTLIEIDTEQQLTAEINQQETTV
jgi:hypothetical protein